jgi:hypothetical protein
MVHQNKNLIRLNVIKAAAIIINVATIDLGDSLDTPQTECPLVHPFDREAPTPTKNPAITRITGEEEISNVGKGELEE